MPGLMCDICEKVLTEEEKTLKKQGKGKKTEELQDGDTCPSCKKGVLYEMPEPEQTESDMEGEEETEEEEVEESG